MKKKLFKPQKKQLKVKLYTTEPSGTNGRCGC